MDSLYFYLPYGCGADMIIASLISLGCPSEFLIDEWKKLNIEFSFRKEKGVIDHFHGIRIRFSEDDYTSFSYQEIKNIIIDSSLDSKIKDKVLAKYEELFKVEKKIHGLKKAKDMKFTHLGKIDAILEITGFYLALSYLHIEKCYVSDFYLSHSAPATLELLKKKKVRLINLEYETVTPTAALLLNSCLQENIAFSLDKYGIGIGKNSYLTVYKVNNYFCHDSIVKIEVNIDDINPQLFDDLFDKLYQGGAKEVYIEQVVMKKSRPAFVVCVLTDRGKLEALSRILFSYTPTFGLRYKEYQRYKLPYHFEYINTPLGKIRFRISDGIFKKAIPEYEDCRRIAKAKKIPLYEVYSLLRKYV